MELLANELSKHHGKSGIIIEGFPRTMEQAEMYNAQVWVVQLYKATVFWLIVCQEFSVDFFSNKLNRNNFKNMHNLHYYFNMSVYIWLAVY